MYVRNNLRLSVIRRLTWQGLIIVVFYDIFICVLYGPLGFHWLDIPWQPVATLGTAVAFYIGFKSNGSYDRFTEGRQLWGTIVNVSRIWATRVFHFVEPRGGDRLPDSEEIRDLHHRLLYRQIAWVNALRLHLRRQTATHWDAEVAPFLDSTEDADIRRMSNPPTHLLRQQSDELRQLYQRGLLSEFRHVAMMDSIQDMFNAQGGCERIKNTPFPRQFAYFSFVFVWIFAAVLPLGLVEEFDKLGPGHLWLTVPFAALVSWVFNTIEVVGHTSENPFDDTIYDVPMTSICRTIEIDLRELLGETDLPPKIEPVNDVLY
ncbi:bestrophin family ion channel [Hymenobacter sp.]|uniref:bestrophin family protein n=1 Tax=Hymenobacter sp. TaxID=1898978 RepID=UPI00286C0BFA|nr:bestrophin family ion channel [Hymenobacter sp.]